MVSLASAFKSLLSNLYWWFTQRQWGIKRVFDNVYEGQSRSETFSSIFRDILGEDYVEEVQACGFLTRTDLRNIVKYLGMGRDQQFVDLGCGCGGAGLWVAREAGARLTGVDISPVAVQTAWKRIADFGLDGRAQFRVGDFAATGLASASFDGAMSVDALYLVPDKTGSVREASRILRPGAKFVLTTWDVDLPHMIRDHRPLLESAGFEVELYETTPDWERRQRAVHQRILAQKDALIREMGEPSARFWIVGAQTELPRLSHMRRILIVARRSANTRLPRHTPRPPAARPG